MIKQIIFYVLFYIYKIWKIIFYIDKKFLDIIANPSPRPSTADNRDCTKLPMNKMLIS